MRRISVENGWSIGVRRRKGEALVALAVAAGMSARGGLDWKDGVETDWCAVHDDQPVGAQDFAFTAGLVCVVHHSGRNNRHFAVASELLRSGARVVYLCRDGEPAFKAVRRPDGTVGDDRREGFSLGQVLSFALIRAGRRVAT